jgi:hypothetical protein
MVPVSNRGGGGRRNDRSVKCGLDEVELAALASLFLIPLSFENGGGHGANVVACGRAID